MFLCLCNQASSLSLFIVASFLALLKGEGVEFLDGFAGAFLSFFFPFLLYSRSSFPSEASTLVCFSYCCWGIGSLITIPLWMGLETLVASLAAGVVAFIGSAVIADISSSALDKEEDSSTSFSSFLLLTLLFSEIGERLLFGLFLLFFFFFFISSKGFDLTF